MKTKHTPGPWCYVYYADMYMLQDGPYCENKDILCFEGLFGVIDKDTAEANAKLAAAAPELLEALNELIPFASEWINDNHQAMIKAKQAIKKATE